MFITVKYGNNESMLCNPSCAVINLLSSIKRRTGYAKQEDITLDLSDETGLIKELDGRGFEHADKYLNSHATYILVQKHQAQDDPEITYLPLLQDAEKEFPDFHLHVHTIEKKTKKGRNKSQSPSPAGVKGIKGQKPRNPRTPSRKK